ncbi:MAG: aldehyde dehydrogenase family protein [Deltaproteobacteria bacterium]|nr:aldehyde dehydrogenase family protein [Deltaproteobacteria bacterium]
MEAKGNFIDGAWKKVSAPTGRVVSKNPAKPSEILWQQDVSKAAVDDAVAAARAAFPSWRKLSLDDRAALLTKLKDAIDRASIMLAEAIAREAGKALWEAKSEITALKGKIDITLADARKDIERTRVDASSMLTFHPHGVMAVLGPFNFPLSLSHGHIVPALLAGNTVVLKPSELTPMVAQLYTELFVAAGFPSGVFNLLHGGGDVGAALATHPDVRGVLFTGSYDVGRAITLANIDQPQKILALEMGGKNASIVFGDAGFDAALYETVFSAFVTTGQRCTATSRLIVLDGVFDRFVDRFIAAAKALVVGDPFGEKTFMGPLVAEKSLQKFMAATAALDRSSKTLVTTKRIGEGYLVTPHVVLVEDPAAPALQEEIFGPSVAIYRARDEEHAMQLANDTPFGLALSVFTADEARFERCLDASRAGIVNWNKGTVGATGKLPFGGVGKSGNFRPAGNFSVRYCTYPVATVSAPATAAPPALPPGMTLP